MFRVFDRAIRAITVVAFALSAVAILLLMVIGSVDVVGTFGFNQPVPAALEMQEVLLAVAIVLAFAHAQNRREHIEVDIVKKLLPLHVQRHLTLLALLAGAVVFGLICWRSWLLALDSWEIAETANSIFRFPIYPGKFLVTFGAGAATLECLRQAVAHVVGIEPPAQPAASQHIEI